MDDYQALLSFIGVIPFTDKALFDYWIAKPLKNNDQFAIKRLEILIRATCLRRTKKVLSASRSLVLPTRMDRVESVDLDPLDRDVYNFFKARAAELASGAHKFQPQNKRKEHNSSGTRTLTLINFLRRICDHGEAMLPERARRAWSSKNSGSVNWQMLRNGSALCTVCGSDADNLGILTSGLKCSHTVCPTCMIRGDNEEELSCPRCPDSVGTYSQKGALPPNGKPASPSSKLRFLLQNLRKEQGLTENSCGPSALPQSKR